MKEEVIELRGGRVQTVFSAGGGPVLLWLHGLDGVQPSHPLLRELASTHSVIAPRAPGFQSLEELAHVRDVHDLALHYDDLLDALQVDSVIAVGESFGAMIAAELAAHFPNRVSSIVLLAPLGLWIDEHPVADLLAVPWPDLHDFLFSESRADPDQELDVEAVVRLSQGLTSVAKFVHPIPDRGLDRRISRINVPALILFGEEDRFVPPVYEAAWARALPGADTRIIGQAGHMVAIEQPATVCDAVRQFLDAQVAA